MINIIYTELFKLKRSSMFLLSVIGALVSPLLNFFMYIARRSQYGEVVTFENHLQQTDMFITVLIGIMLYGLITTYIFNREYQDDTLKNLLTIPVNRVKLLLSKLVVLAGWIILLMLFSFLFCIILGLIGRFEALTVEVLYKYIKIYLFSGLLLYLLSTSVVFITLLFKNYVPSIAFTIFATLASLIILNSKYVSLYPWSIPFALAIAEKDVFAYPVYYSWISLLGTFIIFLTASIIYFVRVDI